MRKLFGFVIAVGVVAALVIGLRSRVPSSPTGGESSSSVALSAAFSSTSLTGGTASSAAASQAAVSSVEHQEPSSTASAGVQMIDVRVGGKKEVSGVTIEFLTVQEDSRCPKGAECIWAGNAVVRVRVTQEGTEPAASPVLLSLQAVGQGAQGNTVRIGSSQVVFTSLSPSPTTGRPIDPATYVATFAVSQGVAR